MKGEKGWREGAREGRIKDLVCHVKLVSVSMMEEM